MISFDRPQKDIGPFGNLRNGGNLPRRRAFPPSVVLAGWMIAAFGMAFLIFAADLSPKVAAKAFEIHQSR